MTTWLINLCSVTPSVSNSTGCEEVAKRSSYLISATPVSAYNCAIDGSCWYHIRISISILLLLFKVTNCCDSLFIRLCKPFPFMHLFRGNCWSFWSQL